MIAAFFLALLLTPARAAPAAGAGARQAQAEYLRGTLLARRGAYADALAAYEKALGMDPSAAFIAGEAAELALRLDDRQRAEKWARRRLELAPGDAKSRVILARVLWARGDIEGAEAQFAQALKDDPTSADTLFALTQLVANRRPQRARELIEQFMKVNPDQAGRALFELGRLDAQEQRYDEAAAKFKRAIEADSEMAAPARLALAQVYEVTGATAAAVQTYQKLLVEDPDDVELAAHIGELQDAMGAREEARATFQQIQAKHPQDPLACSWLAADAERSGDYIRAAQALEQSAALKDDPTLSLRLGYYQLQSGNMRQAMATLVAAHKRWPQDGRIAYYLALGYGDLGEYNKAAALLRQVLTTDPTDRDARWELATILEKMNKIAEAEPEFRRLIADKPDDAPALNYLGYSLADRGMKLAEAQDLIRRALAIEPANPAYRDSLGWVLFKLGRSTEAVHELSIAARTLPDDDAIWDHLGDARRALGQRASAWRAWRLSQSFGGKQAMVKADALQKDFRPEQVGELWRAHLSAVHGGVRSFRGLCTIKGQVAGQSLSLQALLTFHSTWDLTLEVLGPFFTPVARARLDARGFAMDHFSIAGVADESLRAAAENLLGGVAATLAAAPYRPGPALWHDGWRHAELRRPDWRVEVGRDALAHAVTPADPTTLALVEFEKSGMRRIPKVFAISGRFGSVSLSCAEPKIETEADASASEAP